MVGAPKYHHGDQILCVKAKSLYSSLNLDSVCVQHTGIIRQPWTQLGWGFYNSRGWDQGFLRFKTPDWLGDVYVGVSWWKGMGVFWAKGHQVILSAMVGNVRNFLWNTRSFPLGWSIPGWCLGGLSLWSFLETGNLKLRPLLSLTWLGPTVEW